MALKFYTSVEKGLRVKVKKNLRVIPAIVEIVRKKLVGGRFRLPPRRLKRTELIVICKTK